MKRSRKPHKNPDKNTLAKSKGRITPQLKAAIHALVHMGQTVKEAAVTAGYREESLRKALKKPHVQAYKSEVFRAMFDSEKERSFLKMVELRDKAKSERVRADMAKQIAAMDERFQAGSKVHKHVSGSIKHTPGYVIDLSGDNDTVPPAEKDQAENNPTSIH